MAQIAVTHAVLFSVEFFHSYLTNWTNIYFREIKRFHIFVQQWRDDQKKTDYKSTDSKNGNDDNIDSEVIVVPRIVTILDKANLNHIEVSVSPTNVTQKKIRTLIKQNSNPLMELRLV